MLQNSLEIQFLVGLALFTLVHGRQKNFNKVIFELIGCLSFIDFGFCGVLG